MADSIRPMLVIRLLGPFAASVSGEPLPALRSRKGESLLALLALRAGETLPRSYVASLLWPDSHREAALANLRNTLTDLRRALGSAADTLRLPTPRTLALDLGDVDLDVERFDAAIRRGDPGSLATALSIYRGPLLDGCAENWVSAEREGRAQAVLAALETLAAEAEARGDMATAETYLRRVVSLEPLRESGYRSLMRLLAAQGSLTAALLLYRDLGERLHREYHGAPDPETTELCRSLWNGRPEADRLHARPNVVLSSGVGREESGGTSAAAVEPDQQRVVPFAHLPRQLTSFHGREEEMAAVRELMKSHRLVTLTGVGGSGKTRLALEVASATATEYEDGVFFVALDTLADAERVLPTVAATLAVREEGDRSLLETLARHLHERRALLVLDNFEHLLAAASPIVELLGKTRWLTILVTSRALLRARGERGYHVPPLPVPPARSGASLVFDPKNAIAPDLTGYASVSLFIGRAADAGFSPAQTLQNIPVVAEICRRLDGIPLAIELVAPWLRLYSLPEILCRLDSRLTLLTRGASDLPRRQQTLRGAISWSYDLMTEEERVLFRRLAVFEGGCTVEAAEAVCAAPFGVRDALAALVDQSLLRREGMPPGATSPLWGDAGAPAAQRSDMGRFTMLETLREFARDQLQSSGEEDAVRQSHASYFLGWIESSDLRHTGSRGDVDPLESTHDNLRAALAWFMGQGAVAEAMRLAGGLSHFWEARGHTTEGRRWLAEALRMGVGAEPSVRAKALYGAARLAYVQADNQEAFRFGEESLRLYRSLGDRWAMSDLLGFLGEMEVLRGNHAQAAAMLDEAVTLACEVGNRASLAFAYGARTRQLGRRGEHRKALVWAEETLALCRALGDKHGISGALGELGYQLMRLGDYSRAASLFEERLLLSRQMDNRRGIAQALGNLASVHSCRGEYEQAAALNRESLVLFRELGEKQRIAATLGGLGQLAEYEGDFESARALAEESLLLRRDLGDPWDLAFSLTQLGGIALSRGDISTARALFEENLAASRSVDDRHGVAGVLCRLGRVAVIEGDLGAATRSFVESLTLRREIEDRRGLAECFEGLAEVACALGQRGECAEWAKAARRFGAAAALRAALGTHAPPSERAAHDHAIGAGRVALGEAAFAAAWAEGQAMSPEEAVRFALVENGISTPDPKDGDPLV